MGMLDNYLYPDQASQFLDEKAAHKGALASLLLTNAMTPVTPDVAGGPKPDDSPLNTIMSAIYGVSPQQASPPPALPLAPSPWQTSVQDAPPPPPAAGPWQTNVQDAPAPAGQPLSVAPPQPQRAPIQQPQLQGPPMGQPAIGGSSAAAPQGGPFNSGVMGGLSALAHGYDKGGLLGGIADAFGARSPNEEQALNQTYQALIAKGVAPDMAKAAVLNPVLGQQVMSQAFKLPELADVGTDRWGNPIKGWANPVTQSIAPATISGSGQGGPLDGVGTMQGVANLIQNARQLGIQPIDALRKADPTTAGDVQAMIEGRTPISARSSKQQDMLMSLARMIDPSFDAGTFAARQKLRTEFTADGKDGQTIESAGQAIQHLHELSDMGQALHNVGGMGPLNAAVNWTQRGWRGLTQDQRTASFNEMKLLALKEVDKFYSGSGGGSAAEREELNDNINSASSPQQINGVIAHLTEAMGGKLAELDRKWRVGMGPSVAPYPVLSDESRARINDLQQRAGLQPSFPAGGAAGAPAGTREAVEAEMKRRGLL